MTAEKIKDILEILNSLTVEKICCVKILTNAPASYCF